MVENIKSKTGIKCNEKDLFDKLKQIVETVASIKENSCSLEKKYFHYSKIKYAKPLNRSIVYFSNKKSEENWNRTKWAFQRHIMNSSFYKRYAKHVELLNSDTYFSFYNFISKFIPYVFYKKVTTDEIREITVGFFKILKKEGTTSSLKEFSAGWKPQGNYKINDSLVIRKPKQRDFNNIKMDAEETNFDSVFHNSNAVIELTFLQKNGGDNHLVLTEILHFIISVFKIGRIDTTWIYSTAFDYFDMIPTGYMIERVNSHYKTKFTKKDVLFLRNTLDFVNKNYKDLDFNPINFGEKNQLGIALNTYHNAVKNLGSFRTEITPYAVKIINGLLIKEHDDSTARFVRRTSIFLYYLGIRHKDTEQILKIAYTWRSNYFHGTSTKKPKNDGKNKHGLTPKFVELFVLNCARLIIFTLIILKKNNGDDLSKLIDKTYTIEGIKKLKTELKKTKKYFSTYKNGIKIKEPNALDVEILEC